MSIKNIIKENTYFSKYKIGDLVTPIIDNHSSEEPLKMRISAVMFREPVDNPHASYCLTYFKNSIYYDYWVYEKDIRKVN